MNLTPQRTLDLQSPPPKPPKRKPSARAAFRLEEIPVVADAMTGTYALRDRLLFRCNTVWGLRAHEQLSMTVGDICHPDGAIKDSFTIASQRLKGGKPKAPTPPKKPDHYSVTCHCTKCTLYDGRRQPKARNPPTERHLLILPEMKPLLQQWLDAIRQRVGADYGLDIPLWLSRKRGKGGVWRAISRQQYWFIVVEACKKVTLPDFDWHDFGTHSGRKTIVTQIVEETHDITAAQHYIGHASSAMTDKYNRADPRKLRSIGLESARKQWARSAA
ncbi:MAG: tyrosine-type recombinase/integrase [Candidatus Tectomicrobia bacterium]|nr:tyrosine-type recombinase/integrase [Candidatus Tectomicrobia bacterium]